MNLNKKNVEIAIEGENLIIAKGKVHGKNVAEVWCKGKMKDVQNVLRILTKRKHPTQEPIDHCELLEIDRLW